MGFTENPGDPGLSLDPIGPEGFAGTTELVTRAFAFGSADLTAGSIDFPNSVYLDNIVLNILPFEDLTSGKLVGGTDQPATGSGGIGGGGAPGSGAGPGNFPPSSPSAVPLPSAVWLGMALLVGLGVGRMVRRRRSN
jgi:hypothetical protein